MNSRDLPLCICTKFLAYHWPKLTFEYRQFLLDIVAIYFLLWNLVVWECINGIYNSNLFQNIFMYVISRVVSFWKLQRTDEFPSIAAYMSRRSCLWFGNLYHKTCHFTWVPPDFLSWEKQRHVLDISYIDIAELSLLCHYCFLSYISMPANRKVLETMDWRSVHERPNNQYSYRFL